jgi:AraC-like DNA-binding protein
LADIAMSSGFADHSHFSRVFAPVTGMPPGVWRRPEMEH